MAKSKPFFTLMKIFRFIIFFFLGVVLNPIFSLSSEERSLTRTVLVSVAPYRFFVEKIAGDTVTSYVLVPAGASFHTYEPTPRQVLDASRADVWFRIGETFEQHVYEALKNHHPEMEVVDLRKGLDLITYAVHPCHHCQQAHGGGEDLHFWLSPRLAKIQANTIADTLIKLYPEHRETYEKRRDSFLKELDALDLEIAQMLKPLKNRWLLVSHPAYAYFCRDYDLTQFSIEFEGKDPTVQQLTKLLQKAKEHSNKRIYIQTQYSNKGAKLVASYLGAQLVTLDPYAEDYFSSMHDIALQFSLN